MQEALKGKNVIVEIDSYEIIEDGKLGYRLRYIQPEYNWYWWVPPTMLEEEFSYLGRDFKQIRFTFIANGNE